MQLEVTCMQRCCLPAARPVCWYSMGRHPLLRPMHACIRWPLAPHRRAVASATAALDARALCSRLPMPSAPEPAPRLQIDDTRNSGSYLEVQVPVYDTAGGPAWLR